MSINVVLHKILKQGKYLWPGMLLTLTYLFFDYHVKAAVTIPPDKFLRPLLFMWFLLIPFGYMIAKIEERREWSSIYVYLFVLFCYTSKEYFEIVSIFILILLIGWLCIFYILRRKIISIKHIINVFSVVPTVLFIANLVLVGPFYAEPNWKSYLKDINSQHELITSLNTSPKILPDIYYIVLDGYGRADILDEYYGYDNSKFITALTDKGFIVPKNSHSNYAKTVASVSSTLNMGYLTDFTTGMDNSLFWWQAKPYIEHSALQDYLGGLGYTSITLATDWDITNNAKSDNYIKPRLIQLSEYEGNLIEKSRLNIFGPLIQKIAFYPTNELHRELVNFQFNTLQDVPLMTDQPKFVFAHIVSPHPPFVFNKDGTAISPSYGFTFNDADNFPGTQEDYRSQYIGQLEHLNNLLEKTIDVVLAQSKIPPIIIIQADHGPGMLTDFSSSETTCLKERFSTFAAYYLPGTENNPFPEDITPVNLFRIVLNEYFSSNLPLLENKSYYFLDTVYIFRTEDITSKLHDQSYNDSCSR